MRWKKISCHEIELSFGSNILYYFLFSLFTLFSICHKTSFFHTPCIQKLLILLFHVSAFFLTSSTQLFIYNLASCQYFCVHSHIYMRVFTHTHTASGGSFFLKSFHNLSLQIEKHEMKMIFFCSFESFAKEDFND